MENDLGEQASGDSRVTNNKHQIRYVSLKSISCRRQSVKLYDSETGQEFRPMDFSIENRDGIMAINLKMFLKEIDLREIPVEEQIIKCAYCSREERLQQPKVEL